MIINKLFGKTKGTSIFKSFEKKSNYNYFIYPQNTLSSLFYNFASIYMFYKMKNYKIISWIGIIQLFVLGIVSVGWWATQLKSIQKIDVVLYSTTIMYIGFYILILLFPNFEYLISLIFIFLNVWLYKNLNIDKPDNIIKINNVSLLFSSVLCVFKMTTSVLVSILLIYTGLFLKIMDTTKSLPAHIVGTAWFHIFTAIGIASLWSRFQ